MDKSIHYRISLYPHFVHVLQNAENITRPLSEAVLHISTIRCSAVTNGNDIVCIVFLIQKRDGRGSVFVVRVIQTPSDGPKCVFILKGKRSYLKRCSRQTD